MQDSFQALVTYSRDDILISSLLLCETIGHVPLSVFMFKVIGRNCECYHLQAKDLTIDGPMYESGKFSFHRSAKRMADRMRADAATTVYDLPSKGGYRELSVVLDCRFTEKRWMAQQKYRAGADGIVWKKLNCQDGIDIGGNFPRVIDVNRNERNKKSEGG